MLFLICGGAPRAALLVVATLAVSGCVAPSVASDEGVVPRGDIELSRDARLTSARVAVGDTLASPLRAKKAGTGDDAAEERRMWPDGRDLALSARRGSKEPRGPGQPTDMIRMTSMWAAA